jgi:hypothetical protein
MNDKQFEDLCRSGTHAITTAKLTPLPAATWDRVRWESAKHILSSKIVAGEADPHSVDNDLQSFISRVEGTSRDFRCMVPVYDDEGRLVHCGHQVKRKDRILRHVKDFHLHYRPFVCGGRCGNDDW